MLKEAKPKAPLVPVTLGLEDEKGKGLGLEKFLLYIEREEKNLEGVLLFLSHGDLGLSDLHIDPRIESIYVKEIGLGIQIHLNMACQKDLNTCLHLLSEPQGRLKSHYVWRGVTDA